MKKFFSIFAAVCMLAISACTFTSCKSTPSILWNLEAFAKGDGKITVKYPTGNPGLVVEGSATATATTTNDTMAKVFTVPNGGLLAEDVLAEPDKYTKQNVKDAEVLTAEADKAVEFLVEGTWEAEVTGYAKYGEIYVVINEHWPADTVAVTAVVDTVKVAVE